VKDCSVCRKPHDEATKLCAACKAKARAQVKRYRQTAHGRQQHREYERARGRAGKAKKKPWSELSPETQAKRLAYIAGWTKENRDKVQAARRRCYSAHPERWHADRLARRSREAGAAGTFTVAHIRTMYADQDGRCLYCGIELNGKYHIDHMIPIVHGGSNWPCNLALACAGCNLSKHKRTAQEFIDHVDPIAVAS
jgi:5-methylcytosine-specific restriction endonuclease McrA